MAFMCQKNEYLLVRNDYIYKEEKVEGKTTYWKCRVNKCNGSVIQRYQKFREIQTHNHQHEGNVVRCRKILKGFSSDDEDYSSSEDDEETENVQNATQKFSTTAAVQNPTPISTANQNTIKSQSKSSAKAKYRSHSILDYRLDVTFRKIDINFFLDSLKSINHHSPPNKKCSLNDMQVVAERRKVYIHGLSHVLNTGIELRCRICSREELVWFLDDRIDSEIRKEDANCKDAKANSKDANPKKSKTSTNKKLAKPPTTTATSTAKKLQNPPILPDPNIRIKEEPIDNYGEPSASQPLPSSIVEMNFSVEDRPYSPSPSNARPQETITPDIPLGIVDLSKVKIEIENIDDSSESSQPNSLKRKQEPETSSAKRGRVSTTSIPGKASQATPVVDLGKVKTEVNMESVSTTVGNAKCNPEGLQIVQLNSAEVAPAEQTKYLLIIGPDNSALKGTIPPRIKGTIPPRTVTSSSTYVQTHNTAGQLCFVLKQPVPTSGSNLQDK